MEKIRVTMRDEFSGAVQSKELMASSKQLETYKKAMTEGRIIRRYENSVAMDWVINGVETI